MLQFAFLAAEFPAVHEHAARAANLAHFDRIADPPHAIPRLRRFVLDLAVRGKLAPHSA